MKPCNSPYCECPQGLCSHPGCYDARATAISPVSQTTLDSAIRKLHHLLDKEVDRAANIIEQEILKGFVYGSFPCGFPPQFAKALGSKLSVPDKLLVHLNQNKLEWQILL